MKQAIAVIGSTLLIIALITAMPLVWGIWLPDVVTAKENVLGQLITPDGDRFQVVQRWVGDGYLTEFSHTDNRGTVWEFTIYGDGKKAWKASIQVNAQKVIGITVLGDAYMYYLDTHKAIDGAGRSRYVLEIPADGSPAFLLEEATTP